MMMISQHSVVWHSALQISPIAVIQEKLPHQDENHPRNEKGKTLIQYSSFPSCSRSSMLPMNAVVPGQEAALHSDMSNTY